MKNLIAIVILAVIAGYYFIDTPANPKAKEFFTIEKFQPENNAFVALAGLSAPPEQPDTVMYGLEMIQQDKNYEDEPDSLRFQGEVENACFSQDDFKTRDCMKPEQVSELMNKNAQLFQRYYDVYSKTYKSYSTGDKPHIEATYEFTTIIQLQQLIAMNWIAMAANGQGEEALRQWILNTHFLQKILSGQNDSLQKAIFYIVYKNNLDSLPVILVKDQALITKHKKILLALLSKNFLEVFNMKEGMKSDYLFITEKAENDDMPLRLLYKKSDTRNNFYNVLQDVIDITKDAPNAADKAQKLQKKYPQPHSLDLFYNFTGKVIVRSAAVTGEMIVKGHNTEAKQRALSLWIDAKSKNIPAEGMISFLRAAPKNLYNPFTEKPFSWSTQSGSIVFTQDDQKYDLYY